LRNPPVNQMVVDVAAAPGHEAVFLQIAGDVDLAGEPVLASVVRQLAATRCDSVYIDLAGITFAGTTLMNFLVRLATRLPDHPATVLCRPNAMTRRLIELTSLDRVATVRADLPPDWIAPTAATAGFPATPTTAAA
jgi:anti-anti-sigma factor